MMKLLFFLSFLLSCEKNPDAKKNSAEVSVPQVSTSPAVSATSTTSETKSELSAPTPAPSSKVAPAGLAVLEKLSRRADMRAHNESVWKSAATGTDFFKHDALQTHEGASANIKYQSGSSLELKEKTLIIFDKDPGHADRSTDRVLLNSGELTCTTKKELWVFTNAGLVQVKPKKKNQVAKATLSINKERKLKLTVANGSVDLILKKNDKKFQKYNVAEKFEFEFTAKTDFAITSDKKIDLSNIDTLTKASSQIKSPTAAELVIESPSDDTTTTNGSFEIKGRLTDLGAKLLVNGELVEIADDLSFKKVISLIPGANIVVFQLIRSDASVKFYRKNIRLKTQ